MQGFFLRIGGLKMFKVYKNFSCQLIGNTVKY